MSGISIFVAEEGEEGEESDIGLDSDGRGIHKGKRVFATIDHEDRIGVGHTAYVSASLIGEDGQIDLDGICFAAESVAPGETIENEGNGLTVKFHHRPEGE